MKNNIFIGFGIFLLIGIAGWYFTRPDSGESSGEQPQVSGQITEQEKQQPIVPLGNEKGVFNVSISRRMLTPQKVVVMQDEEIIIRVSTDELGEFHVSGYEIKEPMVLDEITEVAFIADMAGRYNFELHPSEDGEGGTSGGEHKSEGGEDIIIGAFIVNPK